MGAHLVGQGKTHAECQTEKLDHYAMFSNMLRLIYDDQPGLRKNVLSVTKFTDLFWKYLEFMDFLKDALNAMPKVRAAKNRNKYGQVVDLGNTEQREVQRLAICDEFVKKHEDLAQKELPNVDSQTELV